VRAFNAVARAGSFSGAARALGLSQPAVTAQVARLEKSHGAPLFERGGHGVTLTETGRRLYAVSQRMGDLEDAMRAILTGADDMTGEELHVATASPQLFMPLIAHVKRSLPGVIMKVTLGSTGHVLDQVRDRRADIGLAPAPDDDPRLRVLPHATHRLAVLMPADHAWADRVAIPLADLAGVAVIMRSGPSITQRRIDQLLAAESLAFQPAMTLETREAVLEAVASGLGLAMALERDVPPDPRVRLVPLVPAGVPVTEHVIWLASREAVATVRAFVGAVGTWAPRQPAR
jgi:molybdate transport repressor ModE-like protein